MLGMRDRDGTRRTELTKAPPLPNAVLQAWIEALLGNRSKVLISMGPAV